MEIIHVSIGEEGTRRFDEVVHAGVPEAGDLELAVKDGATTGGNAGVVVTFSVRIGRKEVRVQAVTTLRALATAVQFAIASQP